MCWFGGMAITQHEHSNNSKPKTRGTEAKERIAATTKVLSLYYTTSCTKIDWRHETAEDSPGGQTSDWALEPLPQERAYAKPRPDAARPVGAPNVSAQLHAQPIVFLT